MSCTFVGFLKATIGFDSYKRQTLSLVDLLNKPQFWLIILPIFGREGLYVQTNVITPWLFLPEKEDFKASSIVRLDAL